MNAIFYIYETGNANYDYQSTILIFSDLYGQHRNVQPADDLIVFDDDKQIKILHLASALQFPAHKQSILVKKLITETMHTIIKDTICRKTFCYAIVRMVKEGHCLVTNGHITTPITN